MKKITFALFPKGNLIISHQADDYIGNDGVWPEM